MLTIDLSGTVSVVIGGSRGIGAAICRTIGQAGGDVAWTHTGSDAGRVDYASAKAGLEGLCRAITKEQAPRGVRCNVVHPSLIETELLTTRYPDPADRARVAEQVPLRRLGRPEDIANITVFLLSERASYITGQSLLVDGGRTFCR